MRSLIILTYQCEHIEKISEYVIRSKKRKLSEHTQGRRGCRIFPAELSYVVLTNIHRFSTTQQNIFWRTCLECTARLSDTWSSLLPLHCMVFVKEGGEQGSASLPTLHSLLATCAQRSVFQIRTSSRSYLLQEH